MKKYLQFALDYMRLFVPGALQNLLDEVAREAYQDGWEHGHEKCLDRSEA